jgi:hypothetical protein
MTEQPVIYASPTRTKLAEGIPSHVRGLLTYLSQPEERANEDLAIAYFRKIYGEKFTRQKEANHADGYVPGSFILELKGRTTNWLSGFFQALAYRNTGLDFSQIVVAAQDFLALWQIDHLAQDIRDEVLCARGAPNAIGMRLAKKHAARRNEILKLAIWNGAELSGSLFLSNPSIVIERISAFETSLLQGRKVRIKVTPSNFVSTLKDMRQFFDPRYPVKTVRAFYSMVYAWGETSTVVLSERSNDQAALGGEVITNLVADKRNQFKDFVENRSIHVGNDENIDDFFARYDEALDAVDRDFRIRHGIFFTDPDLSKFVMWFVRQHIPDLGRNYLVIDPACGSGNLVTNWRSPLEIRHKVVSEIEPELLFAIERRMQGDKWHHGKFTVVPKVSENIGLNFLDRSAQEYLQVITKYLKEKGHKPDRPIAFLCNPPYRSDDDQTAEAIGYQIHESIRNITGNDAERERYCCFLAQMKLICETAGSSGLPGDSLLLLFTKSAWLTKRSIFEKIRSEMLGSFEDIGGMLVNGSEFFDIRGSWPVAFTLWRYKGKDAQLNPQRGISLTDLTWLKKEQLSRVPWGDHVEVEQACNYISVHPQSKLVELGQDRTSIRKWTSETMLDFKRSRRKSEINQKCAGGLPKGDLRQGNKKAYGEHDGVFIGFMDDLTPCRVKRSIREKPWFRLNSPFMDIKKNRCFSGPPDQKGFCAADLESAKKLFFWYSLARTFLQHPYPMWIDSDEMWQPMIPIEVEKVVFQTAFAIAYAENECVQTRFPANNPVSGAPELVVNNPLTPLDTQSFWSITMNPFCSSAESSNTTALIKVVDELFAQWKMIFRNRAEVPMGKKPYLLSAGGLTVGAGIVQIKDYARETNNVSLQQKLAEIQIKLKILKSEFFDLSSSRSGFDYFGSQKKAPSSVRVHAILDRIAVRR